MVSLRAAANVRGHQATAEGVSEDSHGTRAYDCEPCTSRIAATHTNQDDSQSSPLDVMMGDIANFFSTQVDLANRLQVFDVAYISLSPSVRLVLAILPSLRRRLPFLPWHSLPFGFSLISDAWAKTRFGWGV